MKNMLAGAETAFINHLLIVRLKLKIEDEITNSLNLEFKKIFSDELNAIPYQ